MSVLLATDLEPAAQAQWLALLQGELPGERLVTTPEGQAGQIDIAIVANPPAGALRGLPRLAFVQSLWAGVDRLLARDDLPAGVPLARMVDPAMSEAMAEAALWAVLALQRDAFVYAAQQRSARWLQHPQRRADEWRVTVLGLGEMGRTVAERLRRNGYPVRGWSTREGRWPQVLEDADVVIDLLPLTDATRGLLDARAFAAMKPGASLVNLARGAQVVEADLLHALDQGHLRHAVLDVFDEEPLAPTHRFWSHPRVTVLPHVAAQTDPRSAAAIAAAQVRRFRSRGALQHLVDRTRGY